MVRTKILVLEDSPGVSSLIINILDSAGYDVIHAAEGKSAIKMVLQEKPQLVLVDIMVPEIDGIEVCRALRTHPKTSHIKVIMVTCLPEQKEKDEAFAAGASDYIVKPFTTDRLLDAVKTVLQKQ